MANVALMHIQALGKARVVGKRALHTLASEGRKIGQCDVVQRLGGRSGNGAGHVGDAVVHDALFDEGWCIMRCWVTGFEAAPLVYGYVDQGCSGLHFRE